MTGTFPRTENRRFDPSKRGQILENERKLVAIEKSICGAQEERLKEYLAQFPPVFYDLGQVVPLKSPVQGADVIKALQEYAVTGNMLYHQREFPADFLQIGLLGDDSTQCIILLGGNLLKPSPYFHSGETYPELCLKSAN